MGPANEFSVPALYIHIPFCKKKCNYCDFVSYAGKEDSIDEYVKYIISEILNSSFVISHSSFDSIYFGGGTPTLLAPHHFDKILNAIQSMVHGLWSMVEISVESNPGTADLAKLQALRSLGINRLSIGVQSFNDRHLKTLGRIHDAETARKFYDDARAAGFDNINLDLIFGLPGQTLAEWKNDLQTALTLQPDHLSTYNLQVEPGTPFSLLPSFTNEETELAMYEYTIETLTAAGYKHYEISNFAKPGFECRHNINYWKNGSFIGIGTGAKSQLVPDPRNTIFLGLRLLDGLEVLHFKGFEKEVEELMRDGLLMAENGNYKLTRRGLYLGNVVFEKFV